LPEAAAARSAAARSIKRDEHTKFDAGNCDGAIQDSQRCLASVGYDKSLAQKACSVQYEAYRECLRAETAERRKPVKTLFG